MSLFNQNQDANLFAPKAHRDAAGLYIRAEDGPKGIEKGMIVTLLSPDTLAVVAQPDIFRACLTEYRSYTDVEELIKDIYQRADDKEKTLQGFGLQPFFLENIPEEKQEELGLSGWSREHPSFLEEEF